MARTRKIALPPTDPGTDRFLIVQEWGETGPTAYLQAGLHADEPPGRLVLHHLAALLADAERDGRLSGRVILVPIANPVGLGQRLRDGLSGRFHFDTGVNFNRLHLDLEAALTAALPSTGPLAVAEGRRALRQAWAARPQPVEESAALKHLLFGLALDADLVLDLHCDSEAILHVYGAASQAAAVREIAAFVGAPVVLLADTSGDRPFDEALSAPWGAVRERLAPGEFGTVAVTLELRGATDVDDTLARADALALLALLARYGIVRDASPVPVFAGQSGPLEGVDMIAAPCPGLVIYGAALGERVAAGAVVAEVLDAEGRRHPVVSRASGVVFARLSRRLVRPGDIIVKVAGEEPLAHRQGVLLTA
ncbi:succinylglutamate desuccinylase/aspartoacylase domain-containing protein [Pararhodospirillum photometricum]|uniref:Succinylglutamate desuccinylase/aspartoacylase n=1 Tax=Pararhodospirillum photometricum DSM 122 TaxID=1150469 RepID=H6SPY3_PARPM|nr:succinylglutamate desuccinylase/aspartoacylase family protein [Pararhodospirillum photometricum]CCG07253.1 Succinylglutamate desuccinylase/aspartoacylase [Pararhodospirillum photometricum DSM 122]